MFTPYFSFMTGRLVFLLVGITVIAEPDVARAQHTPEWVWAIRGGGKFHDFVNQCAADSSGNCYIAGTFTSDGALGDFRVAVPANSGRNFLAKVDARGRVVWFKSFGGETGTLGAMYADLVGNVFITGFFNNQVVFEGQKLESHTASVLNLYVAKYDIQGNTVWCRQAGGKSEADVISGSSIVSDSSGNCFVSGNLRGRVDLGSSSLFSPDRPSLFLAKYDSRGTLLWAIQISGDSTISTRSLASDPSGNCYMAGTFGAWHESTNSPASLSFGTRKLKSHGKQDLFIAKFAPGGALIWSKSCGGQFDDEANGITADESGSCYVTGMFAGAAQFDQLEVKSQADGDFFLGKIGSDGEWRWLKTAGGQDYANGIFAQADDSRGCYIVGEISGHVFFDSLSITTPAQWRRTLFLAKYSSEGRIPTALRKIDPPLLRKIDPAANSRGCRLFFPRSGFNASGAAAGPSSER